MPNESLSLTSDTRRPVRCNGSDQRSDPKQPKTAGYYCGPAKSKTGWPGWVRMTACRANVLRRNLEERGTTCRKGGVPGGRSPFPFARWAKRPHRRAVIRSIPSILSCRSLFRSTPPGLAARPSPVCATLHTNSTSSDPLAERQNSICVPSSTTRFGGMPKNSVALRAFCDMSTNSFLRHRAMLPISALDDRRGRVGRSRSRPR